MKILMLPSFFGGIGWWRFEVPAKALRELGHEVYCPNADQLKAALTSHRNNPFDWLATEMPKYDIVHVGYSADPTMVIALFKCRDATGIPVVTDVDDDLDHVPTYNRGWASFYPGSRGQRTAKTQMEHSDGVTFSTQPLADVMGYVNPNHVVLGNWIDVDSWDHPTPRERGEDESIRLMITGGGGRWGDWEIFREPLKWAMDHYDGTGGKPMLRLFFMGATPEWVLPYMSDKADPLSNRVFYLQPTPNVTLFNRIVRYVSPDIIISPVVKNEFNKSKSGLKFLEASLTGAAFLCTDYPTYDVAPSGTCLKVDNTDAQWRESLAALIEDSSLRGQLVEKARDYVLANCLAGNYIQDRVSFYEQVISARRAMTDANCRQHEVGREAAIQ